MKDAVFNGGGIKSTRIQDTYLDNSKFIGADIVNSYMDNVSITSGDFDKAFERF